MSDETINLILFPIMLNVVELENSWKKIVKFVVSAIFSGITFLLSHCHGFKLLENSILLICYRRWKPSDIQVLPVFAVTQSISFSGFSLFLRYMKLMYDSKLFIVLLLHVLCVRMWLVQSVLLWIKIKSQNGQKMIVLLPPS